jgi:Tfp pilus assembly protein PilO
MIKTILSIILFVVSGGLIFAYASPAYTKTQATLAEAAQYTEANSKVREVEELRAALSAKYNQLSPQNLARLQSFLPDHVDNVKLVLDMDGIAARRGIRIGNVSARKEEDVKAGTQTSSPAPSLALTSAALDVQKYKALVLDFTVVASYNDFILFMRDLEQSLRVVDLVTLKMSASAPQNGISNIPVELRGIAGAQLAKPAVDEYQYTVSIKTYWLP